MNGLDPELIHLVYGLYNAQMGVQAAHETLRSAEATLHARALQDSSFMAKVHIAYDMFCRASPSTPSTASSPGPVMSRPYGLPSPVTPGLALLDVPTHQSGLFTPVIVPDYASTMRKTAAAKGCVSPDLISPPTSEVDSTGSYFSFIPLRAASFSPPPVPSHVSAPSRKRVRSAEEDSKPVVSPAKRADSSRPRRSCRALQDEEELYAIDTDDGSDSSSLFAPSLAGPRRQRYSTEETTVAKKDKVERKRSKSNGTGKRRPRDIAYNAKADFERNSGHCFYVVQLKEQPDVSERNATEVFLVDTETDASSALVLAVQTETMYHPAHREADIAEGKRFTFASADGTTFRTMFTSTGSLVESSSSAIPRFSFVHFQPGSMVIAANPVGSLAWWRLQACSGIGPEGRHRGMPGDGSWTARWDVKPSDRRPARIVNHFATCKHRRGVEDPLGRFARAVVNGPNL